MNPWLDPGVDGRNLRVEDFPTFLLWRLANVAKSNVTKKYLERFKLNLPEWRLLAMVTMYSPMPFGEVTARSSMDKGQVSRTLHTISARGLVFVQPVGGKKSRNSSTSPRIEVSVTAKGKALHRRIVPVAQYHQMKLLTLMTERERQVYYTVTRRLLDAIIKLDFDQG
ncbi:MAG: MarR family winged helix-turn-helix transcriptional regulator [Steroidobacteraceae bacterium]